MNQPSDSGRRPRVPVPILVAAGFCLGGMAGVLLEVAMTSGQTAIAAPAAPGPRPPSAFVTSEDGGPPAAARADTRDGALAEGLQFEKTVGSGLSVADPSEFASVMRSHFATPGSGSGGDLIAGVLKQTQPLSQVAQAGARVSSTQMVLTDRVAAWTPQNAVLDFYTAVVSGTDASFSQRGSAPLQVLWSVDTLRLVFTPGGWRVTAAISTPGPNPQPPSPAVPARGLPEPVTWDSVAAGAPRMPQ